MDEEIVSSDCPHCNLPMRLYMEKDQIVPESYECPNCEAIIPIDHIKMKDNQDKELGVAFVARVNIYLEKKVATLKAQIDSLKKELANWIYDHGKLTQSLRESEATNARLRNVMDEVKQALLKGMPSPQNMILAAKLFDCLQAAFENKTPTEACPSGHHQLNDPDCNCPKFNGQHKFKTNQNICIFCGRSKKGIIEYHYYCEDGR